MNGIQTLNGNAVDLAAKTEMEVAVTMAKRYPRVLSKFRQDAMTMATIDPEIAASCFYKMARGGKSIEGPSIRLAEIVANAWGNLKFGARIIEEGDRYVIAQGVAYDLEKMVSNTVEVRRRITNRDGDRFNDDMIAVTCNAACSIAMRNVIFKTVPFTYCKVVYEQAKKTAIGDAKTVPMRRQSMVEAFSKMGVTKEMILAFTAKMTLEDIGLQEIENLIGVHTAIKDGDTTIDEQFVVTEKTEEEIQLAKDLKKKRAALNKSLLDSKTIAEWKAAKSSFADDSDPIWTMLTGVRERETFFTLAEDHESRITTHYAVLMAKIENSKSATEFYKHLEEFALIEEMQTVENEEKIASVGRGLGCQEYFPDAE